MKYNLEIVKPEEIPVAKKLDITRKSWPVTINHLNTELTGPDLFYYLSYILKSHKDAIGIHAVQLGIPIDVFAVKFFNDNNFIRMYANCNYKPTNNSKVIISEECCLSFPLKLFKVKRFSEILISGYYLREGIQCYQFESHLIDVLPNLIVFQHEIDHGKNITINKGLI